MSTPARPLAPSTSIVGGAYTPHSQGSRQPAHVPELDGLRGFAVLCTIATHWQSAFVTGIPIDGVVRKAADLGWMGVEIFFVLSGYLITGILLASRERESRLRDYLGRFMWRRALRIMPLYYATLIVLLFVLPLVVAIQDPAYARLHSYQRWYWLYGVNWLQAVHGSSAVGFQTGHLWSLSVEEQFYLAWPLLVWWAGPRRLPWLASALWAASISARWLVSPDVDPWRWTTPLHLDGLMVGALLAWTATTIWWAPVTNRLRRLALPAVCALVVTAWFGLTAWTRVLSPALTAIALGTVLAATLTGPRSPWRALCASTPLRRFGTYSYCLYIVHYPLLAVLDRIMPKAHLPRPFGSTLLYAFVYAAVLLAVATSIAALSWRYFEQPILTLKDRNPLRFINPPPRTPRSAAS